MLQQCAGERWARPVSRLVKIVRQLRAQARGPFERRLKLSKQNMTTGASSDIQQATRLARAMVTQFGYSDKLGTVAYGENNEEVFLGMSMGRQQSISESTAQTIDAEVKILVDTGYADARLILTEHNEEFVRLAQALLEYETLTGEECKAAMRGERIIRKDDDGNNPVGSAVPTTGRSRPRGDAAGGLEPQPTT